MREAISHAIDVDGIITHVLGGRGIKLGTVVNPMKFGYDASVKPVAYDPAKSKQLLAEAGLASGVKLEFMTYSGSIIASRQVGDAVSGYLNKVGIQTNHQHIEDIGLSSNLERTGKLKDIYLASWGSWSVFDADMILYPRFHSSEAFAYVRDPKLDEWLDIGRNTVNAGEADGGLPAGPAVRGRQLPRLPDVRPDVGHGRVQQAQLQGRVGRDDRPLAGHLEELTTTASSASAPAAA